MGFDAVDFAMVFELVSPGSRKNDRFLKPVETPSRVHLLFGLVVDLDELF